jgi:hypothetical protein
MSTPLKRIAVRSLEVFCCLVLADLTLGGLLGHAFFRQTSGKFYRVTYTMDKAAEDLIIYGSSHAAAHYVPEVLESELGMTCYNGGVAGQQILFHTALQTIALARHRPQMMVLDVDTYGYYLDQYQYDRLSDLHPYYARHPEPIGKVLDLKSNLTKHLLRSKLYRFNSTIVHVVRYWLAPQKDRQGYQATFVEVPRPAADQPVAPVDRPAAGRRPRTFDPNMFAALEQFIRNAQTHRVDLLLTFSPTLYRSAASHREAIDKLSALAGRLGVRLISFIDDPDFLGRHELFADPEHLNDRGARLLSKKLAAQIRAEFPGRFGK